jgi:mannosyltransferase
VQLSIHRARLPAVLVLIILVAGAALRLYGLGTRPFWLDEAYSAYAADHDWRFLWTVVPTYETHPPFYYSLLHLWRGLFGDGVLALRLPGALCGIATIGVVALAARELGRTLRLAAAQSRWLIVVAAGLAALHPDLLIMSRQVRPYPVMILVYAAAMVPLLQLAASGTVRRRGALAAYAAAQALMLWLHSLGPLFAGAMGLALLAIVDLRRLSRVDWAWLIGSQLAALLVWLPAMLILADQAPTWIASTWLVFRPGKLLENLGILYADYTRPGRALGLLLAVACLAVLLRRPQGRRIAPALLLLAIVPTAASIALSIFVSPVFLTRTLSAVAMPALLLMAVGVAGWTWARWLMLLPLVALLASMARLDQLTIKAPAQEDWYGAARFVRDRAALGDEVWAYPNESALPFAYAARDLRFAVRMRAVPTIVPSIGVRGMLPTGSRGVVSLYPDDIARLAANRQACAPRTLWLLRTGAWTYDKADLMLKALSARRVQVARWQDGPIDIIGLSRTNPCATNP